MSYQPSSYRRYQDYQRQSALSRAQKRAMKGKQSIAAAIEANGERMSEEGRGLLEGLKKTLGEIAGVLKR